MLVPPPAFLTAKGHGRLAYRTHQAPHSLHHGGDGRERTIGGVKARNQGLRPRTRLSSLLRLPPSQRVSRAAPTALLCPAPRRACAEPVPPRLLPLPARSHPRRRWGPGLPGGPAEGSRRGTSAVRAAQPHRGGESASLPAARGNQQQQQRKKGKPRKAGKVLCNDEQEVLGLPPPRSPAERLALTRRFARLTRKGAGVSCNAGRARLLQSWKAGINHWIFFLSFFFPLVVFLPTTKSTERPRFSVGCGPFCSAKGSATRAVLARGEH